MYLLKWREFDVYKGLRELNLMNAIELLMKQHYAENIFFFLQLFVSTYMHSFNIYT